MLSKVRCTTNTDDASVGTVIEATPCTQPATNELCRIHGVMIRYLVDVRHWEHKFPAISFLMRMDILKELLDRYRD